jgi:cytochrome c-type biogenesis protein CcmH/NrfG
MATAEVKLICGSCGAALKPGTSTCASCGAALVYPGGMKKSKQAEFRPSEPKRGEKRKVEPWIVVAAIAIVALLATVVYTNLDSSRRPAATPAGPSPASLTPAAPMINLAPLEQAVRDNPGDSRALLQLANGLHDARDWLRAIDTYEKYLAKEPGDPDARVDMGICYFELAQNSPSNAGGYYTKAIAAMEAALKKAPRHQSAMFNLGIVNLQMGNLEASNSWFRRTVAVDSTSALGQRSRRILEQHTFNK